MAFLFDILINPGYKIIVHLNIPFLNKLEVNTRIPSLIS